MGKCKKQYRFKRVYSVVVDGDTFLDAETKATKLLSQKEKIHDYAWEWDSIKTKKCKR